MPPRQRIGTARNMIGKNETLRSRADLPQRSKRIVEIFKQGQYNPVPVEVQVAVIWAAQNQYMDDVPVNRAKEFQNKWTEFVTTRKVELLRKIAREKAISDALKTELKAAADEFKATWK